MNRRTTHEPPPTVIANAWRREVIILAGVVLILAGALVVLGVAVIL